MKTMSMDTIKKNIILTPFNLLYRISPAKTLKILFRLKQGYSLHLDDPKTFNEKLQWIKLYDHDPRMSQCCDKYTVRKYIEQVGCGEILNDLIWEGFDPEEIPFDILPEQCVIKVTHGSTFNIICTDKNKLDREDVKRKCRKWLKAKFIPCYGEWFYGVERPRIIVEKFLDDDNPNGLTDYKVFCFNGKAKIVDVHTGRFSEHKRNVYDIDWNPRKEVFLKYPHAEWIEKPAVLDQLIAYAEKISSSFLHARVDFYIVRNRIYFGEITFTNGAGFDKIKPYEFDCELGSYLVLPKREKEK